MNIRSGWGIISPMTTEPPKSTIHPPVARYRLAAQELRPLIEQVRFIKEVQGDDLVSMGYGGPMGNGQFQFIIYPNTTRGLDASDKADISALYAHYATTLFDQKDSHHLLDVIPNPEQGRIRLIVDHAGKDLLEEYISGQSSALER